MGWLTIPERNKLVPLLPVAALLSITWTAWLPTYAHFRRAELQGRNVRVRGRERYVVSLFSVRGDSPPPTVYPALSHRYYRPLCGWEECLQQPWLRCPGTVLRWTSFPCAPILLHSAVASTLASCFVSNYP